MNLSGHFAGSTDTPLTDEGRQQAKKAGQLAKDLNIDYIICSPLSRAQETAQIIARSIGYPKKEIHINNLFTERHFGELEGTVWAPDMNLDGISDIETVDDLLERANLALQFIENLDKHHILIVSHGSFGRAIRSLIIPQHPYTNKTSNPDDKDKLSNAEIHNWI